MDRLYVASIYENPRNKRDCSRNVGVPSPSLVPGPSTAKHFCYTAGSTYEINLSPPSGTKHAFFILSQRAFQLKIAKRPKKSTNHYQSKKKLFRRPETQLVRILFVGGKERQK